MLSGTAAVFSAAVAFSLSAAAVSRSTLFSQAAYSGVTKTVSCSRQKRRSGWLFFQKGASCDKAKREEGRERGMEGMRR
jgi:beta-glucanase (GH16 family)